RVFGHVDAEGGVGHALGENRQHGQPRHDERPVADAVDVRHARADGRAEHDEVERGGQNRRGDTLKDRAPGAAQLEAIDGTDRVDMHRFELTRLTKISSSELSLVCRSRMLMPCSASLLNRVAMPVRSRCVSKVYTSSVPWPVRSRWKSRRSAGTACSGARNCSV